ncbi:glycosyltransferase family 39 protein [Rhodococcoides kyotonense]|uniref:Mannosyltransferase n=1 Tax=Rhodococcoides kyotonense TaxID=398843 RepID=A0A239LC74_9NOCA|nr:glycosyltransferase family 39 protein [Rhodococcus kyotonensis]SNT27905.1 mannosyltransferase [Rhodococcus kyotonensis]
MSSPGATATRSAVALGLFAFCLGAWGIWRPSFWYDEVATVYASRRSWADLVDLLRNTDAAHGVYYAAMHLWGSVFGFSELSTRLPSALAIGVAAAGVVVLGNLLATARVGVFAGIVFAVLPRATWAATEARSYALTAALAVWLTVVLLIAGTRWWWWIVYGAVLAASIVLFVYLATLVVVHLVVVLVRRRDVVLPWAVSAAVAGAIALPFVKVVVGQVALLSWIPPLDRDFPRVLGEYQYFLGAPWFAVIFLLILVVMRPDRRVLAVAVPWILVPAIIIAVYSIMKSPLYLDRYFTFTTPAAALLGGAALGRLSVHRWLPYTALGAMILASLPAYLQQRTTTPKPLRMDFSLVNGYMSSHMGVGDCVLFGRAAWNPSSMRLVEDVDPSAFAGTRSIGLAKDAASSGQLWDDELPVADTALDQCETVWYFTDRERAETEIVQLTSGDQWVLPPYRFESSEDYGTLRQAGFHVDERVTFEMTQVVRLRHVHENP